MKAHRDQRPLKQDAEKLVFKTVYLRPLEIQKGLWAAKRCNAVKAHRDQRPLKQDVEKRTFKAVRLRPQEIQKGLWAAK